MAVTSKRGGVEVDGLAEAIKALGKIDKALTKTAVNVMRDAAKLVQLKAQRRIGNHPSYRLPTNRGMIGRSATRTGAGVKLRASRSPWALQGEYGEQTARIPQRRGPSIARRQATFSRRTAAPFKPPTSTDMFKNRGGYWIQPTIRKEGPAIINDAQKELFKLFQKHLGRR